MASIRASALLIVSLVVALVAPASQSLAQTTWTAELVDPNGEFPDAAWGPNGPAIAYTVFGSSPSSPDSVDFAYLTDVWHVETVSSSYIFAGGASPKLALDANGEAWIVYFAVFLGGSVLAHRTGPDSWETVTSIPNAEPADLEFAPDGTLAMVVTRDPFVLYATWDGVTLRTSRVARGIGGSLAFERGFRPAVAYNDADGLSYAVWSKGSWRAAGVDHIRNAQAPSLDFVSPKEPVIAYSEQVNGTSDSNLRLAHRGPNGIWRTRPVDTGRRSGVFPSLGVGNGETIYIAYLRGDFNNADLRFARHTPTFQEATTIFTGLFFYGGNPSLVVDPLGVPHVAFADSAGLEFGSPST
jgi:hypothetical protein